MNSVMVGWLCYLLVRGNAVETVGGGRGRRWISVILVSSCVCEVESRPQVMIFYVGRNQ